MTIIKEGVTILSKMITLSLLIITKQGGDSMNQNVLKTLMNPIRIKIFLHIQKAQHATTGDIARAMPEVPQASLYRHISKMVKEGILSIESENKIRGVYEKTYIIKNDPLVDIEQIVKDKDREQLFNLCYSFTMSILSNFDRYLNQDDFDLREDRVGFRTVPMYMNDDESDEFIKGMHDLLTKYSGNESSDGRRLRQYSYAFLPADEKE